MTVLSTELREGDIVKVDGVNFKVVSANLHTGGGKTGAMVHAKLRSLDTGHAVEKRLATTERLEKLDTERVEVQFLYEEGENLVFMNNQTYDQLQLKSASIGAAKPFLKEGAGITIHLYQDKPIAVDFPQEAELKVTSTGAGLRGDSTFKEAVLENGVTVMVPQFIKEGDRVRINVETKEFMDRVADKAGAAKQVYKPPEKPKTKDAKQ
ncbi:MAG: elongation factor P [Elusimicrobia bacterium]|nr:elongation factor P [Elusimicrobiota bacterium]